MWGKVKWKEHVHATIPSFYRSLFHSPQAAPVKSEISAEATCAETISEIQVYQKESVQEHKFSEGSGVFWGLPNSTDNILFPKWQLKRSRLTEQVKWSAVTLHFDTFVSLELF